jgi:hypothetical protein
VDYVGIHAAPIRRPPINVWGADTALLLEFFGLPVRLEMMIFDRVTLALERSFDLRPYGQR